MLPARKHTSKNTYTVYFGHHILIPMKRQADSAAQSAGESSSDDDDFGPKPAEANEAETGALAPTGTHALSTRKKARKLEFEQVA